MTAITHREPWTIGVEEEYQIIDPITRALTPAVEHVLMYIDDTYRTHVQHELQLCQIETATPICRNIAEVRAALICARQNVIKAATQAGYCIAAAGTHPFSHWEEQSMTPHPRFVTMIEQYQQLTREQIIMGCHIHIGCHNRSLALEIANRARLWLAPILALSASSPYWLGHDTGYASFRTEIWWRWPLAGPPPYCSTYADYQALIETLTNTQCIEDSTHLYWDIRLSERYPTIEFRIADICMTIDEAVMIAGLIRALVQTCAEQAEHDEPYPHSPTEILKPVYWHAARYGLEGGLINLYTHNAQPAQAIIEQLLTLLQPALVAQEAWQDVSTLVRQTLRTGNGAQRQRRIYQRTGQLQSVVDFIVQETARGVPSSLTV
jgi:carboxylate-amine ligase, YbdK family